jgi:hypothetical protein
MVLDLRPQSTGDTIIAAFDKRPGHLFECGFHLTDVGRHPPLSDRQAANIQYDFKIAAFAALILAINSAAPGLRSGWYRFARAK